MYTAFRELPLWCKAVSSGIPGITSELRTEVFFHGRLRRFAPDKAPFECRPASRNKSGTAEEKRLCLLI